MRKTFLVLISGAFLSLSASASMAQKRYDVGATDTEIKIGNIAPYSGPVSAYSAISKTEAAYFKMLNEKGGINGRKLNFISYDDGYSPPKTVEQVRRLVESDEVLLVFNPIGTAPNSAIQKYMNSKKVPHLFVSSGATKWNDPKHFPWTIGWQPNYQIESRVYASHILTNYPGKTIGVLYANDDFGKDYLTGLKAALGDQASKAIVAEIPYDNTSPTVDSQVVQIRSANPDIFMNITTPKFAAQAIKKIHELGWKPVQFLTNVSVSVSGVMQPAGYEASQGILSAAYLKDSKDEQWDKDPAMADYRAFMSKYYPDGSQEDFSTMMGYALAKSLQQVLTQCKDDLTRENVMKQAADLNFDIDVLLPGIRIKTSPSDFAPIEQLQLMRFKGETWELFGPVLSGQKEP